jgi:hypothetical protein
MQKAAFLELLKSPEKVKNTSFEDLEQAILDFPYCLPLRLLLLRKYKENDHVAYERYLSLATLYAPNLQKVQDFLVK